MFETTIFSIFSGDVHARVLERGTQLDIYSLGPLWDYTCIAGLCAAAGRAARASAFLVHGRQRCCASQASTVVSACVDQGTEALCTNAWIIGVAGRHCSIPTSMAASRHIALSSCLNHLSLLRNGKPSRVRWGRI